MKKLLVAALVGLSLVGCGSYKTANYTFNQTTGASQPQPPEPLGLSNQTAQDAGRGSTNSGGSGNTIIIIESSDQDAKSDPDLSGVADAVVDRLTGGLTDVPDVVGDLAEPEVVEETNQGNVVEVE